MGGGMHPFHDSPAFQAHLLALLPASALCLHLHCLPHHMESTLQSMWMGLLTWNASRARILGMLGSTAVHIHDRETKWTKNRKSLMPSMSHRECKVSTWFDDRSDDVVMLLSGRRPANLPEFAAPHGIDAAVNADGFVNLKCFPCSRELPQCRHVWLPVVRRLHQALTLQDLPWTVGRQCEHSSYRKILYL
jgi:hypothetical protein